MTGKDTKLVWVPADFLEKHGENGDGVIPIWAPAVGTYRGMHLRSNAKAVKAGLTFRPAATTVRDTLAYFKSLPAERQAKPAAFVPPEREAELLAAWAKAQAKPTLAPTGRGPG